MKKTIGYLALIFSLTIISCGSEPKKETSPSVSNAPEPTPEPSAPEAPKEEETIDPMSDKGIGPVKEVEMTAIKEDLAKKGEGLFKTKCTTCHNIDSKLIGPALIGVTKRRTPEWIMNQILNPLEMTQKDPISKNLLAQYKTQMTFQDVTKDDARAILEYFRSRDK